MNTDVNKSTSLYTIVGLLTFFTVLGVVLILVPVEFFKDLLTQITERSEEVVFDKGIYYMFGGGVFFLLLVLSFFLVKVLKVSENVEKIFVALIFISIILVFALPQIMHYSVGNYLENEGYRVCEEKSTRWLHAVTIVYTKTLPCSEEGRQPTGGDAGIY